MAVAEATGKGCMVHIGGGNNAVTLVTSIGACSTSDGTNIVVVSDGDATYTLKNRLGATLEFNRL